MAGKINWGPHFSQRTREMGHSDCLWFRRHGPSARQRPHCFFLGSDPAHAREDILHCKSMCSGADAGHGIFDEDELVASIEGGARGGFDTEVRGNSAQDDRTDSSPAELLIELRAVKCAPLPLRDQQVARLISALGNNL